MEGRQRSRHEHLTAGFVGRPARQRACGPVAPQETVFDVRRIQPPARCGVRIGRDDVRAGVDEIAVHGDHGLRIVEQRAGRPESVAGFEAARGQFLAHAAIQDERASVLQLLCRCVHGVNPLNFTNT